MGSAVWVLRDMRGDVIILQVIYRLVCCKYSLQHCSNTVPTGRGGEQFLLCKSMVSKTSRWLWVATSEEFPGTLYSGFNNFALPAPTLLFPFALPTNPAKMKLETLCLCSCKAKLPMQSSIVFFFWLWSVLSLVPREKSLTPPSALPLLKKL